MLQLVDYIQLGRLALCIVDNLAQWSFVDYNNFVDYKAIVTSIPNLVSDLRKLFYEPRYSRLNFWKFDFARGWTWLEAVQCSP